MQRLNHKIYVIKIYDIYSFLFILMQSGGDQELIPEATEARQEYPRMGQQAIAGHAVGRTTEPRGSPMTQKGQADVTQAQGRAPTPGPKRVRWQCCPIALPHCAAPLRCIY